MTADEKYVREYDRTFNAISDSRVEDPNAVRLHPSCPRQWMFYVSASGFVDIGSWCRQVHVRQDTVDPYVWRVSAHYSSRVERPDLTAESPLLRPAVPSWDTVSVVKVAMEDRDGRAILNSSKERFDPPPEIEEQRISLKIELNQASYNAIYYSEFCNTVNSHPWAGWRRGQVRCVKISGTRQFENGLLYWKTVYEFLMKRVKQGQDSKDVWAERILDRGWHQLDANGKQERIFVKGMLPANPVLLTGNGGVLPAGADPVYKTYHLLKEMDFNDLLRL